MNKRLLLMAVMCAGCVKEITSDERLERESPKGDVQKAASAAELAQEKCDDITPEFEKARDGNRTEEDRLNAYSTMYVQLRGRTVKFDEAMSRNPDLAFREGSQELVAARDACIQASADARNELETLVREIMQVLIVDDVRSGQTVKVARIDFAPLRTAIERLDLDDKDALVSKINGAEKQVEATPQGRKRRGGGN